MNTFPAVIALFLTAPTFAQFGDVVSFNGSVANASHVFAIDVDLDGDSDAVVVDQGRYRLQWFETLGAGRGFRSHLIASESLQMRHVAAFDVDQDGDEDVVSTFGFVAGVGFSHGWYENNAGTFSPFRELIPAQPAQSLMAFADMDGDSILDMLLVRDFSPSPAPFSWCRGLGGAAFDGPAPLLPASQSTGRALPVDLDADGDMDLIYSAAGPNSLVCLRNDGAWPAYQRIVLTTAPGLVSDSFDVADVDGNGLPDIAFRAGNNEYLARNQGALSFTSSPLSNSALIPTKQVFVDIDGDNDLDLFSWAFGTGPVQWRENLGGAFSQRMWLPGRTSALRGGTFGDFDGDGWPDLLAVTALGAGGWSRNDRTGTHPIFELSELFVSPLHTGAEFATGDFDLDGDPDLAVLDDAGITLLRNDGAGRVTRELVVGNLPPIHSATDIGLLRTGDYDGDGVLDLVLRSATYQLIFLHGNGDGTFAQWMDLRWPGVAGGSPTDALDVDGDGILDLVLVGGYPAPVVWSRSDGTGSFAPPISLWSNADSLGSIVVADFNRDGFLDVVAHRNSPSSLLVHFGVAAPGVGVTLALPSSAATVSFIVGDIDLDGDLDIIQSRSSPTEQVAIYKLEGNTFAPAIALAYSGRVGQLLLIDADSDGDQDIVVSSRDSFPDNHLSLYEQTGPMNFQSASPVAPRFPFNSGLQKADFDRDGDQDILWASEGQASVGIVTNVSLGPIGSIYCGNAVPNSTGSRGSITAGGSDIVGDNAVILSARHLPPQSFGFFVGSKVQASIIPVNNSIGRLCLGGAIARFTQSGQVASSGPSGQFFAAIDLTNIPAPTGSVAVSIGETWSFQAWHRDVAMGAATSNFTTAVSILLR